MNSEEIVEIISSCLEAIEQGESVEACLARFPEYAEEIEPLLRVAATLRAGEPPTLSGAAFVRGRGIVAQAAASRKAARPVEAASQATPRITPQATGQSTTVELPREAAQAMSPGPIQRTGESGARRQWAFPAAFSAAVVAAAILLGLLVTRGAMISLPGDTLYPLKRAGEQAQGALMTAAGEDAEWRARLAERRLDEALALEAGGRAVAPELLEEISLEVEAVLVAAEALPDEEREEFLTVWLAELRELQPGVRGNLAGVTGDVLAESIAATESSLGIAAALAPTFTPTATLRAMTVDGGASTPVPPTHTPQPVETPAETDTAAPQRETDGAVAAASPSPAAPAPSAAATLPQAVVVLPSVPVAAPTIAPTPRPEVVQRATNTPVISTQLPTMTPVAPGTVVVEPTTAVSQIAEAEQTLPAVTQAFTQGPSVASGDLPTPDGAVAAGLLPSPTPFLNTSPALMGSAEVTLTDALTETATGTPTATVTVTPTGTITPTVSVTATPTSTPTPTDAATDVPVEATGTATPFDTPTPTLTPPLAPTETATVEPSPTPFDTPTFTPEPAPSEFSTVTPTVAPTETPTSTPTSTSTETPSPTASPTPSPTSTMQPGNPVDAPPLPPGDATETPPVN